MASGHASPLAVIVTTIVFTVVAAVLTIGRLYTRTQIVRNAGVDDVFISISLIASMVMIVTTWMEVHYGMGRHSISLDPEDVPRSLFWLWTTIVVYNIALGSVKLSVLLQYLRIFPRGVKNGPVDERHAQCKYRIASFVLIAVVSVATSWAILSAVFTCLPVQKFWNADYAGGCLPRHSVWQANAGINIATEICTVALPLPVLRSLQVPRRQKQILMLVFGIAFITVVISILRLPFLYIFSVSDDVNWDSPMITVVSDLEINIAIMCSCIPTLRGLISRLFPSISMGEKGINHADDNRDQGAFDGDDMDDLEGCRQPGNRCSSQSSANTTSHLNTTCFNATARLDD